MGLNGNVIHNGRFQMENIWSYRFFMRILKPSNS